MGKKKNTANAAPVEANEVAFDYIKSPQYRAIHADGVYGGLTPRGYIHMAIWNQRHAIPQRIVQALNEKGELGEEIRHEGRDSIVREVDIDVLMDVELAKALVLWLIDKIDLAEAVTKNPKNPEGTKQGEKKGE